MPSIDSLIAQGMEHHQAGRLAQAEQLYRQVITRDPNQPEALHLLGVIAHQCGRNDVARQLIESAIQIAPGSAEYHNNLGHVLRQSGELDGAVRAFERAIECNPVYGEAYSNLGLALFQLGQPDRSAASLKRAIELRPHDVQLRLYLGIVRLRAGQIEEAIELFRSAALLEPKSADALSNLSAALKSAGRLEEAIGAARQAIALDPSLAEAHFNLGIALQARLEHAEALSAFEAALGLRANYPEALNNYGVSLHALGRNDEAVLSYQKALSQRAHSPESWCNLAMSLQSLGRPGEAAAALRNAIEQKPDFAQAWNNLGFILLGENQPGEAIKALERAIAIDPGIASAHSNLGSALHKQGLRNEAIAAFRQALAIAPNMRFAHANILLAMNYDPNASAGEIFNEHVAWAKQHVDSIAPLPPPANDRDPGRRLRIGYVSPDFCQHSVAYFLEPILRSHDPAAVEIFCFADVFKSDAMTARLRSLSHHWHDVHGVSDEALAGLVREKTIDILVDLAGHTGGNRLAAFAQKPAPVQITYLGYPNTTGMRLIDYRLTDALADPIGEADRFHSEALWRLPTCAWCYCAPDKAPAVGALPAQSKGHITFGSFNKFTKITPPAAAAWANILKAVPTARLLVKSMTLGDAAARQFLDELFQKHGIAPDRYEFAGRSPTVADHLDHYNRIDIALDTFPYNGTTTTCDALYMGVPVIVLAGDRHVSRVGVSLLTNAGLGEFIAESTQRYCDNAINLANDLPRLGELRRTLRSRMLSSALMDASRFTRDLEHAYRQMWHRWCAKSTR